MVQPPDRISESPWYMPPHPPPASQDLWYHSDGEQKQGPLSEAQLIALVKHARLTRDHFVRPEGRKGWQLLGMSRFAVYLPVTEAPAPMPVPSGVLAMMEARPPLKAARLGGRPVMALALGLLLGLAAGAPAGWWWRSVSGPTSVLPATIPGLGTSPTSPTSPSPALPPLAAPSAVVDLGSFRAVSRGWTVNGDYSGSVSRSARGLVVTVRRAVITPAPAALVGAPLTRVCQELRAFVATPTQPQPGRTSQARYMSAPVVLHEQAPGTGLVLSDLHFEIPLPPDDPSDWPTSWLAFQLTLRPLPGAPGEVGYCYARSGTTFDGTPID